MLDSAVAIQGTSEVSEISCTIKAKFSKGEFAGSIFKLNIKISNDGGIIGDSSSIDMMAPEKRAASPNECKYIMNELKKWEKELRYYNKKHEERLVFSMKFDTPNIIRKIKVETGLSELLAKDMAQKLNNIQPELYGVAVAWVKGQEKPFEFREKRITLEDIQKKYNPDRISAILTMDSFLKNPTLVDRYSNVQMIKR